MPPAAREPARREHVSRDLAAREPTQREPTGREPTSREDAELVYGLHAGLAVFARRPGDILELSYEDAVRGSLRALLDWATAHGVRAREVSSRELSDQADSNQHEGLVLRVRARVWLPPKAFAAELVAERALGVALDRVRNPQNIGAILRSAAFFGARAVLLGAPAPHPGLAPFALRVAQGAAEHLSFSRTTDLADSLGRLRSAGIQVIGADTHATRDAEQLQVSGAALLVFGHEREGLSPRIRAQCDTLVGISGSGAVESLNVAVAAGVIFAGLRRSQRASSPPQAVQNRLQVSG